MSSADDPGVTAPRIDRLAVLALFDDQERFCARDVGLRREEQPHVVRHVDLLGKSGVVIYSSLSEDTVDAAIQDQMAYFGHLGQQFEWKVFGHDQPPDLIQRLAAHGFEIDETEAVLVHDLGFSADRPGPARDVAVRRISTHDELREVGSIKARVYGDGFGDIVDRLAYEMDHAPETLSVYVACVGETPAACGWIRFRPGGAFAGLWGGSTVPELRHRGLYTALVSARLDEARRRGVRFATVDAGPMSRPLLEKRGFQLLTHATACTWHG
jgi:GNAT superfamily N-acetyltransferase